MKANYEEVWETLVEYGIIDEKNIYDDKSLIREIEKNDRLGRIQYSLFYELLETEHFKQAIQSNLKVQEFKKKDVVQDGEKFVIPKTRQVTYYRKGRKVQYYLAQKRKWNENETQWMKENRSLPTKLMLYKYYQNFGEIRTVSSVMTKRSQLSRRSSRQHMAVKKPGSNGRTKRRTLTKGGVEVETED